MYIHIYTIIYVHIHDYPSMHYYMQSYTYIYIHILYMMLTLGGPDLQKHDPGIPSSSSRD